MRILATVLLLVGCASPGRIGGGSGPYRLITDTYHGPITWYRFRTLEECQQASRESAPDVGTRCATAIELERERRRSL